MISILLIVFIILAIMSRGVDIDLDINVTENFDPIYTEDEVVEEVVDPWIHFQTTRKVQRQIEVEEEISEVTEEFEEEDEVEEDDCYSGYFQSKRLLSIEDLYYRDLKRTSKRGDHGHKGYTRTQTLAYKKAREFKSAHLNEWC